jgi:hypothetical protein
MENIAIGHHGVIGDNGVIRIGTPVLQNATYLVGTVNLEGGGIELGNSMNTGATPYIDFHFGTGNAQDYNIRLINSADQELDFIPASTGQAIVTVNSAGLQVNGNATVNGTMQVNGNATVNGTNIVHVLTITGGSDVAEPFDISTGDIPKGSLVVIDDAHPGLLKVSEAAYDHKVAGIISGANGISPGITLRQQGLLDGGQFVALSGRVYALADATYGPIDPGDLLTTSATPSHAMRVSDPAKAQGAVIGKAMSPLKTGRGFVLVLVTLQ